ncbi:hypothetical protein [Desulfurococcus mucosus]|uniref:Uncharacterized protein n=1 Tax=Desulfurococcus mucosus (strain ATCC 35584 / DSM 2162 / JCM 9187 / O7/1) TaxID=765177 RepID=E8R7X6_DESM0|nr:hypothetical protein [Desulfurococcus mucosus]ADV64602.1 hypothetical protein Desmu_0283 [Desulfurococcus mucosus DSM 2162]
MKGVSETFSTLILVGVFTALALALIPYSYFATMSSLQKTEYEYVKHVFKSMAAYFPNIVLAGEYAASIPAQHTSIGYTQAGRIEVYLNSSSTPVVVLNCAALTLGAGIPGAPVGLVYGVGEYLVGDVRFVPRVYEYRSESSGLMTTSFDVCRMLLSVDVVLKGDLQGYYYVLQLYNLTVHLAGGNGHSLRITPTGLRHVYSNIAANLWNITIVVYDYIVGVRRSYGVADLVKAGFGEAYAGVPFSVDIVVEDVVVEVV